MDSIRALNIHWRSLKLCINVGTIISGACTFQPLGHLTNDFEQHCILYADVKVKSANATAILVDTTNTIFGQSSQCMFTTYAPVLVAIHAFIWCWFFLFMKLLLKSEKRESSMLLPSCFLHAVMFTILFVSSSVLSAGVDMFCNNLVTELGRFRTRIGKTLTCSEIQDLEWSMFDSNHTFYTYLLLAKASSWIMTLTVLCQCVVCGYKLYVWFLNKTDSFSIKESTKLRQERDIKPSDGPGAYSSIDDSTDIHGPGRHLLSIDDSPDIHGPGTHLLSIDDSPDIYGPGPGTYSSIDDSPDIHGPGPGTYSSIDDSPDIPDGSLCDIKNTDRKSNYSFSSNTCPSTEV